MAVLTMTLEEFRHTMLAQGYDEVVERHWEPHTVTDTHSHSFEAHAIVVKGEMILSVQGEPDRKLGPNDRFHLMPNVPHSEHYTAEGATYWVARKHGAAAPNACPAA